MTVSYGTASIYVRLHMECVWLYKLSSRILFWKKRVRSSSFLFNILLIAKINLILMHWGNTSNNVKVTFCKRKLIIVFKNKIGITDCISQILRRKNITFITLSICINIWTLGLFRIEITKACLHSLYVDLLVICILN